MDRVGVATWNPYHWMRRQGTNRMETIGPDADLALGWPHRPQEW